MALVPMTEQEGVEVLIVSNGEVAVNRVKSDIQRGLEDTGLKNAAVSVKIVQELERTRLGKTKRYIPLS